MVQTNGSYLNARIKDLLSRGNFRIGVSLDSLKKDVFESIRINANFDRIIENIKYFSEYSRSKNEKFALALCVMRQNWRELPAFVEFCNEHNAVTTFHKVWYPDEFTLHNLTYTELKEIYDYLSPVSLPVATRLQQNNSKHYQYIVASVKEWMDCARENKNNWFVETNVKKWRNSVFNDANRVTEVDAMDEIALMAHLKQNLQDALIKANATPAEIAEVERLCNEKIGGFILNYHDAGQRLQVLRQICQVPPSDIINTLKHASLEMMMQQAKTFLVGA